MNNFENLSIIKATKYTEIGYHGRDVDDIIKDLVATTIRQYRSSISQEIEKKKGEVINNKENCENNFVL